MRGSRMREVAALLPILLHGACALHATPSLHHPRSTSAMARRLDRLPHSLSLLHMRSEDDPLLISSEVSIIFAYAFARALCTVLIDSDFPGWAAPVSAEPVRLGHTFTFAAGCSSLWVSGGLLTGGFAYSTVCDERTAAVSGARVAAASLLLYLLFAFCSSIALGACVDPFCADAALWEQPSARLLSITPNFCSAHSGSAYRSAPGGCITSAFVPRGEAADATLVRSAACSPLPRAQAAYAHK